MEHIIYAVIFSSSIFEEKKHTYGSNFSQVRDVIDALLVESRKSDRLVVQL